MPGSGSGGGGRPGLRPFQFRELTRRHFHRPDPASGGRHQVRTADGQASQGEQGAGSEERSSGNQWARSQLRPGTAFLRDGHGTFLGVGSLGVGQ